MHRPRVLQVVLVLLSAAGLAACGSSQPGQPATTGNPSTPAVAAPEPGQHYQAEISQAGQPELSADGGNIVVTVHVHNAGTGTFGSATAPHPVNIAAHSIDASGEVVNNDLARGHLPQVGPGATVPATIRMPADQLMGKRAEILPVQEGVAWFDQWGTKPLVVGPFEACGKSAEGKVCDAAGKPLPVAAGNQ